MMLSHRSDLEINAVASERDECHSVREIVRRTDAALATMTPDYAILVNSDGSTDGTDKRLNEPAAEFLLLHPGQDRFLSNSFQQKGDRTAEIPIAASPRFARQGRFGFGRIVDVFLDAAHAWFQTSAKGRPVYLLGRMSLVVAGITGLLLLGTTAAFAMGESAAAGALALFALGSGLCSLGCLAVGVSLELLIETHKAAITGRSFQMATTQADVSEPTVSCEPLHRAA